MARFIKGKASELGQYLGNVGSLQGWMRQQDRASAGDTLLSVDARGILAIDDRHRLVGSYFYYPSANDPTITHLRDEFPFNLDEAFTIAMVWVHETQRGQGLGKTMFAEANKDAIAEGFKVRLGYGQATEEIWNFAASRGTGYKDVDGMEYGGKPFRYTVLAGE